MLPFLLLTVSDEGEKRKIEQLYEEYNRLMYVVAYNILHQHEDAEDAVFSAWEKIIRHIDKINEIKCKETKNFIVIIIERTAIDLYRKKKKLSEIFVESYESVPYFTTKDKGIGEVEVVEWVNALPKHYSEVLLLYYVNQCTQKEIADILSISENTVASRISRAKKILKGVMESER